MLFLRGRVLLFMTFHIPLWFILGFYLILAIVPLLILLDLIFYRNVFKRTEKNDKEFKVLWFLWFIFWVIPIPLIFLGFLAIGLLIMLIMMQVLKIAMLVVRLVELRKSKEKDDKLRRKWLLIALFVPLIGSILFFKIGESQIIVEEIFLERANSNTKLEETEAIFKD